MAVRKTKNPIEYSFKIWMSNFPESIHPLDMKRFYKFVKTVYRYSRKTKNGYWLKLKIDNYQKENGIKLDDKKIEYFCNLFENLLDFCKEYPYPLYEIVDENGYVI